jgi:hypothetical protein
MIWNILFGRILKFYGFCRIVIKSEHQCTYFLFSVNLLLVGVNYDQRTIQVCSSFRLLRTKITIDLLFSCKQMIWPRFLRMQLTLLVTGKPLKFHWGMKALIELYFQHEVLPHFIENVLRSTLSYPQWNFKRIKGHTHTHKTK